MRLNPHALWLLILNSWLSVIATVSDKGYAYRTPATETKQEQ